MQIIRTEKYNSNNAWGFGGRSGIYYYYDNGLRKFVGKYYYRHIGTSSANGWEVLAPDDYYINIIGAISDNVYLFKLTFEGEKTYTTYAASFSSTTFLFDPNYLTKDIIKTIPFTP